MAVLAPARIAGPAAAADASPAATAQRPVALRIEHDAVALQPPGARVHVTLRGTAGLAAWFDVPGVVGRIRLDEWHAGDYEGGFVVPRDLRVGGAVLRGWLESAGKPGNVVTAVRPLRFRAPVAAYRPEPAPGSRVATNLPTISLLLDDRGGAPVDPASVAMRVNGRAVRRGLEVTETFAAWHVLRPLAPGPVRVEVTGRDSAGVPIHAQWAFQVEAPSAPLRLSHSAARPVTKDATVWAALQGPPHALVTLRVGRRRPIPMYESKRPGTYFAEFQPPGAADPHDVPLQARVVTADGVHLDVEAPDPVQVVPRVYRLVPLQARWQARSVVGQTAPGAQVEAVWTSSEGTPGARRARATADGSGGFRLAVRPPPGDSYVLVVHAAAADGYRSQSVRLPSAETKGSQP